jgi:phosphoesterase RecJ-like protein
MNPNSFTAVAKALTKYSRVILSSHARPDGDSIGSQLALGHTLRTLGKTVRIINHDPAPPYLQALPGSSTIEISDIVKHDYDAAVIMECGALSRTEVDGLDRGVIINIDHHTGNAMYGDYNWHDDTAAACCEQVYDLIKELNVPLTPEIAIGLYVGILTDTGSFRHANITPRTFDICRHVAAAGVIVADVAAAVYQNSSIGKIKLTGALLDGMQLECDGRVAILKVDDALLQKTDCPPDDMEGLINLPLSAKSVQAVIMIRTQTLSTRVSLRSKANIDVRQVAVFYGGGGHRNAAGFSTAIPQSELESKLLKQIHHVLNSPNPLNLESKV